MRARPISVSVLVRGVLVGSLVAGCGAELSDAGRTPPRVELTVLAAASLRGVFTDIGSRFEADRPGVRIRLSFGPSSGLANQIVAGTPADVFASASTTTMQLAVDAGLASAPTVFARNTLTIVVPTGNPAGIRGLSDLADPDVTVALCAPQVPCGAAALKVFAAGGVDVTPVSQEADVAAVLAKVTLGEVDAGLVYVTDTRLAGSRVVEIPSPEMGSGTTAYPIAVVTGSEQPALGAEFVDAVTGAPGQRLLRDAGFAAP